MALRIFDPRGRVLELAAGTGQWTGLLADVADELIVTDASPEMLELKRAKVGERAKLAYRSADAFGLEATHDFDVVFFGSSCLTCRLAGSSRSGASWRA